MPWTGSGKKRRVQAVCVCVCSACRWPTPQAGRRADGVSEDDPCHGQEADAVDTGETAGRLTGGQQLGPVGVDRECHQQLGTQACRDRHTLDAGFPQTFCDKIPGLFKDQIYFFKDLDVL